MSDLARTPQRPNRKLRELRVRVGLTSRELAAAAHVAQSTVLSAEHGKTPYPITQLRIAGALDRALRLIAKQQGEPMPPRLTPTDLWPVDVDDDEPSEVAA